MLTFPQNLQDELEKSSVEPYWLLKLYYNDETVASNWIGISGQDRTINSDEYYGILNAPGGYNQSMDIFEFDSSTGALTLTLINTPDSIKEHNRFSDLWNTLNFAQRKWVLYQFAEGLADADKGQIATGIIVGEAPYDDETMELTLIDLTDRINKRMPVNIVDAATYTDENYPERNHEKPVGVCLGDFGLVAGLAGGETAKFERHRTLAKFPAMVFNQWNKTDERVEARLDEHALKDLNTNRIYIWKNGYYIACDSANASATPAAASGEEQVSIKGIEFYVLIPLSEHSVKLTNCTYVAGAHTNTYNGRHDDATPYKVSINPNTTASIAWRRIKVPKLGVDLGFTNAQIDCLIHHGSFVKPGGAVNPTMHLSEIVGAQTTAMGDVWGNVSNQTDITLHFSADNLESWDLEGNLILDIQTPADAGTYTLEIIEIALEIRFTVDADKIHTKNVTHEETYTRRIRVGRHGHDTVEETKLITTQVESAQLLTDYLYASGEGRVFFAEIDTEGGDARNDLNGSAPDPDYGVADLNENPIYQAEEVLRHQGGLDKDDIDLESFDLAGEKNGGTIKNVFDLTVANIKFAGDQFKFIMSKDFLKKLGKQCGAIFFNSGNGKIKVFVLQKPADYSASDITFDFNDCVLEPHGIFKSSINNVRNYIKVHYGYNYAEDQNTKWAEPSVNPDGVSNLWTVNGFGKQLALIYETDFILDSDTADGFAQYLQDRFKNRFQGFSLFTTRPKYNRAEIGDIADFTNFPSDLKVYGATQSGYYAIVDNTKFEDYARFTFLKVS